MGIVGFLVKPKYLKLGITLKVKAHNELKKITIEGNTFNIPKSWNDVTIKQQITVEKLIAENPEFKSIAVIAGYLNVEFDLIKHLHINEVKLLLTQLDFYKTKMESKVVTEFEFNGEKYFITPTLLKSEFQDFLSIETAIQNYKGKEYNALPIIIAVLAKRKDETLDSYDLEERAKLFENLPLPIADGIYSFFLHSAQLFSIDSNQVLKAQNQHLQELIDSMQSTIKKHRGGGLRIRWQKARLQNYLSSLKKNWIQYFSGLNLPN